MSAAVGDEVQINEWIGIVVDVTGGVCEIEWDDFGGPLGSRRSTNVPLGQVHIRSKAES